MHEVSLMENALAIALDYAARDGARRIDKLSLRVGPLAGVEPSALQFAFDIVTQDTLAAVAHKVIAVMHLLEPASSLFAPEMQARVQKSTA